MKIDIIETTIEHKYTLQVVRGHDVTTTNKRFSAYTKYKDKKAPTLNLLRKMFFMFGLFCIYQQWLRKRDSCIIAIVNESIIVAGA